MRLVVLGSAEFSLPTLRAVAGAHDVSAVVTQPDRPGDRGRPAPRPVADAAREMHIALEQPARIRENDAVERVLSYRPDALVVAAYGQIIPAALLEAPRFGGVNVHASLLPRWRGAAPVAAAILAGDERTGVSIMQMDAGLDTGAVFAQREVQISDDATTPALTTALAELGASLLLEVLALLERGEAVATPQDDTRATHAPRLRRSDGDVQWSERSARDVDRKVRALQPWPGVTADVLGQRVALVRGTVVDDAGAAGEIVARDGESIVVAAREGAYRIDALKPPGGREMTPAAWLRGRRA
ncbi:MAG TPA: methionyl-tRNA formyltransferase [Candidatus Dormibacteraeota bacterium]|nr:methionyl-tRNA formyltransferase [Candidatus Dormibacteraeota bacterium]